MWLFMTPRRLGLGMQVLLCHLAALDILLKSGIGHEANADIPWCLRRRYRFRRLGGLGGLRRLGRLRRIGRWLDIALLLLLVIPTEIKSTLFLVWRTGSGPPVPVTLVRRRAELTPVGDQRAIAAMPLAGHLA